MSKSETFAYEVMRMVNVVKAAFSALIGLMIISLQNGNHDLAFMLIWPFLIFIIFCFMIFPVLDAVHKWIFKKLDVVPGYSSVSSNVRP